MKKIKVKEFLKDKKSQALAIFGIFVGVHLATLMCWYAVWFWNLIFSL